MNDISDARTFTLGDRVVKRLGYGAMQLAGPGVFGPPKDREAAIAVLREAVASGVDHIDTSDYLRPSRDQPADPRGAAPLSRRPRDRHQDRRPARGRRVVEPGHEPATTSRARSTTICAISGSTCWRSSICGSWALSTDPPKGPIEAPLAALADLQRQGLVRHIGLSNVTAKQIDEGRAICDIVCVQNQYNVAHRDDDALIDQLARAGIAYVPFFPLGGFTPLQSAALTDVAERLGATPMQVALAWLIQRAPNILLIPGTSSVGAPARKPGCGQPRAAERRMVAELDQIAKGGAPA